MTDNKKYLSFILIIFLVALFIISIVYFKERIFYYDTSFQFFKILFFETFNIEAGRYSTFLSQLPLLGGVKLGLSLKSLSIIYSASFIVCYSIVYLILLKGFKNNFASLALVLSLAIGYSLGFFHTVTETHQAVVYSFLFLAVLYSKPSSNRQWLNGFFYFSGIILTAMLTFFSHPVAIFLLTFILGYYIIDTKSWRNLSAYILFCLLLVAVVLKVLLTESDSYEGNLFSQLGLFGKIGIKFWKLYSFKFFFKRILGIYLFLILTGFIVAINYINKKNWLKLAYFLFASGIFFIITLVTYHEGNADIAMERAFLPFNVFVTVPFCKDFVFSRKKVNRFVIIYVSVVLISGLVYIVKGGIKYNQRVNYLTELIENARIFNESKFIVYRENLNMDLVEIPWALSTETLFLSSLDGELSVTLYYTNSLEEAEKIKKDDPNTFLLTDFWLYWKANELNSQLFNLKPGTYKILDEKIN